MPRRLAVVVTEYADGHWAVSPVAVVSTECRGYGMSRAAAEADCIAKVNAYLAHVKNVTNEVLIIPE